MLPHHDVVPDVVEGGAVGARQQDSTHDDVAPADGGGAISSGGTTAAAAALATTGGAAGTSFGADGVKTVCQDTCPGHANNGICEDGRPSIKSEAPPEEMAMFLVLCDLGTDCGDCGPWVSTDCGAALPCLLLRSWLPPSRGRRSRLCVSVLLWLGLARAARLCSSWPPVAHPSPPALPGAACRCTTTRMPRTAGGPSRRSGPRM